MRQMPPKPTEKTFSVRKAVLLSLPILVAFLVGGKAGSLVGIEGFLWPAAIGWAVVIGIIDYNFSIMEKLSGIGWLGRIVLIMTSAIITATIGDHIIFKDTIAEEIEKRGGKNEEVERLNKIAKSKEIAWEDAKAISKEAQVSLETLDSRLDALRGEVTYEINNGGCKGKCEEKKALLRGLESTRPSKQSDFDYKLSQIKPAKEEMDEAKDKVEAQLTKLKKSHNIIEEIQVLYTLIFSQLSSMVVFILLSLMVICIETLPLLLKSGVTGKQSYDQKLNEWRRACDAIRKEEEERLNKAKLRRSIILRNNRV